MNRGTICALTILLVAGCGGAGLRSAVGASAAQAGAVEEISKIALPSDRVAQELGDLRWGMFICWSFSTFSGREWTPTRDKDASYFRATGCDTDQWARTAKEAGVKQLALVHAHPYVRAARVKVAKKTFRNTFWAKIGETIVLVPVLQTTSTV